MTNTSQKNLRILVTGALFAAIVTVATYFIKLPILSNGGYIHLGDSFIYLAACLLPAPYAIAAAAIGGGLADLFAAPIWAPYTIVIKALIALLFTSKPEKLLSKRNITAPVFALLITVVGYYFAEVVISKSFIVPLASAWGNIVQAVGSAVIFYIIAVALDKSGFKKTLNLK